MQLTPGHVQYMLADLLKSGRSETTVKHIRSTPSGAVRAAQRDHGFSAAVASLAKMPKSDWPAFEPEVITPEDAQAIVQDEHREAAGNAYEDQGFVFASPVGGILNGTAFTRNFKAHCERRGIKPIRWHALRRVFTAVLQDQDLPLERIRHLMGHSEIKVTEGYAYTMPYSLKRHMGAVDDVLGAYENGAGRSEPDLN